MIQLTGVDQLPPELPKPFSGQVITARQLKDFISKARSKEATFGDFWGQLVPRRSMPRGRYGNAYGDQISSSAL